MNALSIVNELKNYVDNGITRRRKAKKLRTTEIKKVRNQYQFVTEFIDSEYEDWYDVIINVTVNKQGARIQVGDKSDYITVDSVERAIKHINEHLSWRNLK